MSQQFSLFLFLSFCQVNFSITKQTIRIERKKNKANDIGLERRFGGEGGISNTFFKSHVRNYQKKKKKKTTSRTVSDFFTVGTLGRDVAELRLDIDLRSNAVPRGQSCMS